MSFLTYRLGYGKWGTVDADHPENPPQVSQGAAGTDPWPVVVVAATPITTNNLVAIPATTGAVLLLPANNNRKALSIYNDSTSDMYVKFESGVTTTFWNFRLTKNSFWESEFYSFNGEIWGVWDDAVGQALVSELI